MGKSASGKDTIYDRLLHKEGLPLLPYVGYTTRPIRAGEQDGVEYYFTTKEDLDRYKEVGKLIESRVYHTVYGDWYYYSVDSDRVDLSRHDYLYIGTLESYVQMRDYYGADKIVPLYIELDDGLRLERALNRERQQQVPGYAEFVASQPALAAVEGNFSIGVSFPSATIGQLSIAKNRFCRIRR